MLDVYMDERTGGLIFTAGLETHIWRLYREFKKWKIQAHNCAHILCRRLFRGCREISLDGRGMKNSKA